METITSKLQLVKAVSNQSNYQLTPQAARERAGLTIEEAAKAVRICPRYLRRCELTGGISYVLASRLATIYEAPVTTFLFKLEDSKGRCTRNARRGRNLRRATSLVRNTRAEVEHGATSD